MNGAVAGAAAAAVWAAQQPLDKRVFGSRYDDVELLGKLATRGSGWPGAGVAMHLANGAAFGAGYALVRPLVPAPAAATGVAAGARRAPGLLAARARSWTATTPRATSSSRSTGTRRAFAQATWRHLLFGLVLGELERRLNAEGEFEPLEDVPVASNGHGNIEHAAAGAAGAEAH